MNTTASDGPTATTPGVTAPNASATTPDGLIVLWSERHGEVVQASAHNFQMAALQAELAHQTELRESYESACAWHKKRIAEVKDQLWTAEAEIKHFGVSLFDDQEAKAKLARVGAAFAAWQNIRDERDAVDAGAEGHGAEDEAFENAHEDLACEITAALSAAKGIK